MKLIAAITLLSLAGVSNGGRIQGLWVENLQVPNGDLLSVIVQDEGDFIGSKHIIDGTFVGDYRLRRHTKRTDLLVADVSGVCTQTKSSVLESNTVVEDEATETIDFTASPKVLASERSEASGPSGSKLLSYVDRSQEGMTDNWSSGGPPGEEEEEAKIVSDETSESKYLCNLVYDLYDAALAGSPSEEMMEGSDALLNLRLTATGTATRTLGLGVSTISMNLLVTASSDDAFGDGGSIEVYASTLEPVAYHSINLF